MIPKITTEKQEPTWYANIWIAGDEREAIQACREYCFEEPLCVTVSPTTYVYVGGAEQGVCVRLIQYPRFPKAIEELENTAKHLADFLRNKLYQDSYTIEFPEHTIWRTSRQ